MKKMEETKQGTHELPNQLYCPNCVKNQYQDDEDACYEFLIYTKITEPDLHEVRCKRCGWGFVYIQTEI